MTTPTTPTFDDRSALERALGTTEPVRRALYPVAVAVVALLVGYGIVDGQQAPLWIGLAVAVLVPGGIEAARHVVYSPATVRSYGAGWQAVLEGEYARGIEDGLRHAVEVETDEPGEHAVERAAPTDALPAQHAPTGLMRAQSRATRCRETDGGRRCKLTRDHDGPHLMTTG